MCALIFQSGTSGAGYYVSVSWTRFHGNWINAHANKSLISDLCWTRASGPISHCILGHAWQAQSQETSIFVARREKRWISASICAARQKNRIFAKKELRWREIFLRLLRALCLPARRKINFWHFFLGGVRAFQGLSFQFYEFWHQAGKLVTASRFFYLYKWQQMLLNKKVEGKISTASFGKGSGKGFFHVERNPQK